MGSPKDEEGRDDDETQHRVTLTRGFWLAKTECTQGQWESEMGENPSEFRGTDLPVERVSWFKVQDWLWKMSQRHPLPTGWKWGLPTEAQWEYACRAGTQTPFSFGYELDSRAANFDGSYPYGTSEKGPALERTSKAGNYPANPWGLHDMHGNVWEWCADWYGDYEDGPVTDPTGSKLEGFPVHRGGSWNLTARHCRSAARRDGVVPGDDRHNDLGFRPAAVPSIQ